MTKPTVKLVIDKLQPIEKIFGTYMRRLRKNVNISQEELAVLVSTKAIDVLNWESGESLPAVHQILRLAQIFGIRHSELKSIFELQTV